MKSAAICILAGGLGFVFMAYQVGMFDPAEAEGETQPEVKVQVERKKFPRDLAPAAKSKPEAIPEAAPFNPDSHAYPLVFLKLDGTLYEDWQKRLNEEWAAETVEQTQLAVIVGPHKKFFVSITTYPNGAPPVERFRWELEASVVEVKTGKVLAFRTFVNQPRRIKPVEAWELTMIGEPVQFRTVFNWVSKHAKANFPQPLNPEPIVTVVE